MKRKLKALPKIFLVLLPITLVALLVFYSTTIINNKSYKTEKTNSKQSSEVIPEIVEGVSTRSAWIKGSKDVTPVPSPSFQEYQQNSVSYPEESKTGAGQDVGGASAPTYIYPIYIEEAPIIQPSYETVYIEGIGLSYSCLSSKISEIKQADQDYLNKREEVARICAANDATQYEVCTDNCSTENFEACEKDCYDQIDWSCSINVTLSPEYRNLSYTLSMYCK